MRVRAIARVVLLLAFLAFCGAFLFSLVRAADWTSRDLRNQIVLACGAFSIGWRPEGWMPSQYDGTAGYSISLYGDWPGLTWLPNWSGNRAWQGWTVPIWMPAAICLAALLLLTWYDRTRLSAWWLEKLTPARRIRLSWRAVAVFAVLHLAIVSSVIEYVQLLDDTKPPSPFGPRNPYEHVTRDNLFFVAEVGTPVFGAIWAGQWIALRNRLLLKHKDRCFHCGYDLQGLVERRCPECGTKF